MPMSATKDKHGSGVQQWEMGSGGRGLESLGGEEVEIKETEAAEKTDILEERSRGGVREGKRGDALVSLCGCK